MKNNRKNRKRVRMELKNMYRRMVQRKQINDFRVAKVRIIKGIPYGQVDIYPVVGVDWIPVNIVVEDKESPQSIINRFNESGLP